MHELSIAQALVSIVEDHARGRRVTAVEVKVGHLRQVVPAALELAFELVAAGTPAEGARLELEQVPAAGCCRDCGARTEFERFPLACGECGSSRVEITRGEELLVDALEMEEEAALATSGGSIHGGH
jgi:hydrogenase nickel incorporation protein HypA/HybF